MLDTFHDLLREHGKSITKPRSQLFQYLQQSGPVTVAQFMRQNAAVADRASLYRALLLFRSLGVIEDRIIQGRQMLELTDRYDSHHHHLTCERCGKSVAITMPEIEQSLVDAGLEHGFIVKSHSIELAGVCADCELTTVRE